MLRYGGHVCPPACIVRLPPDIVVEVVSPSPRDERRDRIAGNGGAHESVPGCSGLQLDLDEIWSEIARLEGPQQG